MKTRGAAIALITGVLLAAPSRTSQAQSSPSPPAAGTGAVADPDALARTRFSEGVAFAKKQVWPRAYAAFIEAWKLKEHPQIALNLGRAEIETGRYKDAIEHLRYCVARLPAGDADLPLAREWLAEAEKKVARLAITVDVPGAEVLIDGAPAGTAPLAGPVLVDPGKHALKVTLGEQLYTSEVELASGASASVDVQLPPAPSPVPTAAPPPSYPVRKVVLFGGAGLTVVAAGLGATLGGLALQKQSERDLCASQPTGRDCWVQREADRATLSRASLGAFAGAGLFAVGTAAFLLFGPAEPRAVIAPAAGVDGAGLVAVGRF